jgi:tetratricopeptide (TPR) repeat protein
MRINRDKKGSLSAAGAVIIAALLICANARAEAPGSDAGPARRLEALLESANERLERVRAEYGFEDARVIDELIATGSYCQSLGRYAMARIHYREALRIAQDRYGATDDRTLTVRIQLADLYQESGQSEMARRSIQDVTDLIRLERGHDHPDLIELHKWLGDHERAAGNVEKAQRHYRELIRIVSLSSGPYDIRSASAMRDLALMYRDLTGEYDKAIPLLESALRILVEKGLGDEEVCALTMNDLALTHMAAGDPAAAAPLCDQALKILLRRFGPDHPGVLEVRRNALSALEGSAGR